MVVVVNISKDGYRVKAMEILVLERNQILSFRRQSSVKSGKHQVTKMGHARRRLWEISPGGRRINEPVFR